MDEKRNTPQIEESDAGIEGGESKSETTQTQPQLKQQKCGEKSPTLYQSMNLLLGS